VDLQLSTEQEILRSIAARFLAEHYDYRTVKNVVQGEPGWRAEMWLEFARLGWLGLPFAVEDGGSGGEAADLALLMEAFGRHLVTEPYLATVVLAGGAIAAIASAAERREWLPAIAEGRLRMAFAGEDRAEPTRARDVSGGFFLEGAKKIVLGAPMAKTLLVSARLDSGGTGLFVAPADSRGLTIRPYRTIDGGRAADLELASVALPSSALLGGNNNADALLDAVVQRAMVALSADAVGAIGAMVAATVEYAKTRVQFGQPLGKFQALQHRLVQMKVKEEEARASSLFATLTLDAEAEARTRAVYGAKAKIGRAARFVHQSAIQLHGAIGTTPELSLGAYAKRLMAYEKLFASTDECLARYAGLIARPGVVAAGLLAG